jgi:hypothetical protein
MTLKYPLEIKEFSIPLQDECSNKVLEKKEKATHQEKTLVE